MNTTTATAQTTEAAFSNQHLFWRVVYLDQDGRRVGTCQHRHSNEQAAERAHKAVR
jgi:hypothetical protein